MITKGKKQVREDPTQSNDLGRIQRYNSDPSGSIWLKDMIEVLHASISAR